MKMKKLTPQILQTLKPGQVIKAEYLGSVVIITPTKNPDIYTVSHSYMATGSKQKWTEPVYCQKLGNIFYTVFFFFGKQNMIEVQLEDINVMEVMAWTKQYSPKQ